jgi:RND superfamily putative drug exporter
MSGGWAGLLCGRRTKWIVLVAWLLIAVAAGPLSAKLAGIQQNDSSKWLPSEAESTQVLELQERFRTDNLTPAIVVYERESGVTAADRAKATADAQAVAAVAGVSAPPGEPIAAPDGRALQTIVLVRSGGEDLQPVIDAVDAIRAVTGQGADGLNVHVAGPAGISAATNSAFADMDAKLLMATVAVVIVLLLITYRSPTLWLLPVIAAGIALTSSQSVIYLLSAPLDLTVNGQSVGILTILVFGAGTDYALLLISRYREELRRHEDRHDAMARALRQAAPAILASAATVIIGMMCLIFAQMSSTSGLGPVSAIGIVVGFAAMVTLLPALLVICGRWLFWPAKPKLGSAEPAASGVWSRLGKAIARRPRTVWISTSLVLGLMALGVTQMRAEGLPAENWFVNKPDAIIGQEALGRHFPAGEGQPVVVIGKAAAAEPMRQVLAGTPGIAEVSEPVVRGDLVEIEGILKGQTDSDTSRETIAGLRDAVHDISGADAKVGGAPALTVDLHNANNADNRLIIPLVLLAVLLILGVLLRSIVAPLLLIATVVLSYFAALGITTPLFEAMYGFNAADSAHPLFVFVFLVALGIDYNIFLMTRVREESFRHGTRRGTLIGLSTTGGVITSAGVVLAATFLVFGSMPLITFAQMGIAVAVGVLLDTFIVRSVLVTALSMDLGRWMWWPGKLFHKRDEPETAPASDSPTGREPEFVS